MCVRWKNAFSDSFPIANGVRQGGVLSFTIYIDDLLDDLRNRGVGCFWDSVFAGAIGYADDVVLLAPSPAALRIMLHCCEDFAFERGLQSLKDSADPLFSVFVLLLYSSLQLLWSATFFLRYCHSSWSPSSL